MGIVNRIINILVLVAAIAAIVLGVMLFNKREDMTKGRELMAQAIVNADKKLLEGDAVGIKKFSVSEQDFSVKKTAKELNAPLKNLDEATRRSLKFRMDSARRVADLTKIIFENENAGFEAEKLASFDQGLDELKNIIALAEEKTAINAKIREAYFKTLDDMNTKFNMPEMEKAKLTMDDNGLVYRNKRFEEIAVKGQTAVKRYDTFADHVKKVGGLIGVETPSLEEGDYASILESQRAGIEKMIKEYNEAKDAKSQIESKMQTMADKSDEMMKESSSSKELLALKQKELAAANAEIKRLREIINPPKKEGEEQVEQTEEEIQEETEVTLSDYILLQKIQGKVLFVDKKGGFVVIDLGRKVEFTVKDPKGKDVKSVVGLPMNGLMTAATSLDPVKAKFSGKLQIVKLGEKESVANILPTPHNSIPAVGDIVYFTSYDIDAMRGAILEKAEERTKAAAAKAAPAKAAAKEAAAAEEVADLIGSDDEDEEAPAAKKAAPVKKAESKPAAKADADDEDDEEDE